MALGRFNFLLNFRTLAPFASFNRATKVFDSDSEQSISFKTLDILNILEISYLSDVDDILHIFHIMTII